MCDRGAAGTGGELWFGVVVHLTMANDVMEENVCVFPDFGVRGNGAHLIAMDREAPVEHIQCFNYLGFFRSDDKFSRSVVKLEGEDITHFVANSAHKYPTAHHYPNFLLSVLIR